MINYLKFQFLWNQSGVVSYRSSFSQIPDYWFDAFVYGRYSSINRQLEQSGGVHLYNALSKLQP